MAAHGTLELPNMEHRLISIYFYKVQQGSVTEDLGIDGRILKWT
jgi:hypothetical protein